MPRQGYLLIADVTGYTIFLTRSELDHAQGIIEAIINCLVGELKPPLALSNLQGDAVLAYALDENVRQGQIILDGVERIYCGFAEMLAEMRRNTTCTCNACRNMAQLDLKFFIHHGSFFVQPVAGRNELQGPDVIRVHRLLKNDVVRKTGIKAYALVTVAAAEAMRLPDFFSETVAHVERSEDMGETRCHVYDIRQVWERRQAARRVVVSQDEPLAFESLECDLPVPPATAWSYVVDAANQSRWRQGIDRVTMTNLYGGRVAVGSVQHCAHGKQTTVHRVVDWRPFDYVCYHILLPFGTFVRQMVEFTPNPDGGTHVSMRCAKPEAESRLAAALARIMVRLGAAKLVREQRASRSALQRLVAAEAAGSDAADAASTAAAPPPVASAGVQA